MEVMITAQCQLYGRGGILPGKNFSCYMSMTVKFRKQNFLIELVCLNSMLFIEIIIHSMILVESEN